MNLIYLKKKFFFESHKFRLELLKPQKGELTKDRANYWNFATTTTITNFSSQNVNIFVPFHSIPCRCVARITETGRKKNPHGDVQYYSEEEGCKFARELCLKLGSISPTCYANILCAKIPKAPKIQSSYQSFFVLLGYLRKKLGIKCWRNWPL